MSSGIKRIGVMGCGLMGSGIVYVSAMKGYDTVVREVSDELLEKGLNKVRGFLEKQIKKGKVPESARNTLEANVRGTTEMKDLVSCDLIIEAVTEDLELKNELFSYLDKNCSPEVIFASNTSSLKISDMAQATGRPQNFVGLHFFNPVPIMKLVEVVRTEMTSDEVFQATLEYVKSLEKVGVACIDTTGFVVNRLLVPYLLDAIRALEAGIASAKDIDTAMMLGCGYPMGPLTLLDFVGLDTTLYIAGIMSREFGLPQYEAPELLKKLVSEGKLGKKSGEGFYKYER
jgi:3-hydroxybutyryl-CoA dehydrogenase